MKTILILGAGLSSSTLISYMLENAVKSNWRIRLGDVSVDLARKKISDHPRGEALFFNADDPAQTRLEISNADIVISMLPAKFHHGIALECVKYGKNMVTASYITPEIDSLDRAAREKGVILLNETGVDPGIDHMSAMQIIHRIREYGDRLIAFESATGGLILPSSVHNPWNYKFTWNPGNVVLAGQKGARFMHNGKFKYIPYHKIFSRFEVIDIPGYGQFEVYPNRDSLKYQDVYGLSDLTTMFRGTIRRPGFCEAWDSLVQLGATDDSYTMEGTERMTFREFTNSFLAYNMVDPVEKKVADYLQLPYNSKVMEKLEWLGLFDDEVIGIPGLTPARALQHILERKWTMDPDDKDMIIMQHQFDYIRLGRHRKRYSTLVVEGENTRLSAMAKCVGLPVAITSRLILEGKIDLKGVQLPVHKQIYEPVLHELAGYGIRFEENDITVS